MHRSLQVAKAQSLMERSKPDAAPGLDIEFCLCTGVIVPEEISGMVASYKQMRFEHSTTRVASPTYDVRLTRT